MKRLVNAAIAVAVLVGMGGAFADPPARVEGSFHERLAGSFIRVQGTSSRACLTECQNDMERAQEDCKTDADRAARNISREKNDPTDGNAMLERSIKLNEIAEELKNCRTRSGNEAKRCVRTCNAGASNNSREPSDTRSVRSTPASGVREVMVAFRPD